MSTNFHTPTAVSGQQAVVADVLVPDAALDQAITDLNTKVIVSIDTDGTLKDDVVGPDQLADNAVGMAAIADDAVGPDQLADDAVGSVAIADDAVGSAQIADDAVGSAHIADDAVGTAQIADDAVGADQIADGVITPAHLSSTIEITRDYYGPFVFPTDYASGSVPATYTERGAGSGVTRVLGNGTVAIDSGKYFLTKAGTPIWGSPAIHSAATIPRVPGLAFAQRVNITTSGDMIAAGWKGNTTFFNDMTGTTVNGFNLYNGGVRIYASGAVTDVGGANTTINDRVFTSIHRPNDGGMLFYLDDELIWFSYSSLAATDLYAVTVDNAADFSTDFFRVNVLPKPFVDDSAFDYIDATPTDGDVVNATSGDIWIRFHWTPEDNADVLTIGLRGVDDANQLYFTFSVPSQQITFNRAAEIYDDVSGLYDDATDTQTHTVGQTLVVDTEYKIVIKMNGSLARVWVNNTVKASSWNSGFGLTNTRIKVSGFTAASLFEVIPVFAQWQANGEALAVLKEFCNPHPYRSYATIQVPSQAYLTAEAETINTYLLLSKPGDTIKLTQGDHYTLTGTTENGFENMRSGYPWQLTTIDFQGATISGGAVSFFPSGKRWFQVIGDPQLLDAWNVGMHLYECRNFITVGGYISSDVHPGPAVGFVDPTRFNRCKDFTVIELEVGPPLDGQTSMDGIECYASCLRGTFVRCVVHGVIANGYEIWTPQHALSNAAFDGRCEDLTFIDCEAYENGRYGISCEGSPKYGPHQNIVAVNFNSHDNTDGDFEAIQGQTLTLRGKRTSPSSGTAVINETTPPALASEPAPDGIVVLDY